MNKNGVICYSGSPDLTNIIVGTVVSLLDPMLELMQQVIIIAACAVYTCSFSNFTTICHVGVMHEAPSFDAASPYTATDCTVCLVYLQ